MRRIRCGLRLPSVAASLLLASAFPVRAQTAPNPPLFVGETLRFAMTILGVAGGELTLSASHAELQRRAAYKFEMSALSNNFLSKFFLVRDAIVSWVDAKSFRSLRYEKHTVEGRRVRDELTEFDHEKRLARYEGASVPMEDADLDPLSSVYYVRTLPLDSEPVELVVFSDQPHLLRIEVQGRERITVPAGTFDTIRVEPKSEGGQLLGKNLVLWLTDDACKIPVQLQSKLKVGTLWGKLKAMERSAP